jgi:multidrug efflux pump subunit AcrA (membrane-fusion protein)
VKRGEKAELVSVKLGLANDDVTEIVEGLQEGDQVIVTSRPANRVRVED